MSFLTLFTGILLSMLSSSVFAQLSGEATLETPQLTSPQRTLNSVVSDRTNILTYENPTYGFSLQYPSDWIQTKLPGYLISFQPLERESVGLSPYFSVSVTAKPIWFTTLDRVNDFLSDILPRSLDNFTLLTSGPTTVANETAQRIEFIHTLFNDTSIKEVGINTVKDNVFYSLSFGAMTSEFDKYLPTMESILDSFTITNIDRVSSIVSGNQKLLTYEDFDYGIRMQYPSGWEKMELPTNASTTEAAPFVKFISPVQNRTDEFHETLIVGVEGLPMQNMTLDEFAKPAIDNLKTSTGGPEIDETLETKLAGQPALNITYTFRVEDDITGNELPFKGMQIWTIKNNKLYIITYSGLLNQFSESLTDAQKMIDSFKIL